jgi:hypothetical protein
MPPAFRGHPGPLKRGCLVAVCRLVVILPVVWSWINRHLCYQQLPSCDLELVLQRQAGTPNMVYTHVLGMSSCMYKHVRLHPCMLQALHGDGAVDGHRRPYAYSVVVAGTTAADCRIGNFSGPQSPPLSVLSAFPCRRWLLQAALCGQWSSTRRQTMFNL